eukprot:GHVR01057706.1.p1 GENE.GHVR01057706.1~~GHVR01057706.1.p1  ORF type:complete len:442 (-),score=13.91 GHVR01057706.1:249-1574(-)
MLKRLEIAFNAFDKVAVVFIHKNESLQSSDFIRSSDVNALGDFLEGYLKGLRIRRPSSALYFRYCRIQAEAATVLHTLCNQLQQDSGRCNSDEGTLFRTLNSFLLDEEESDEEQLTVIPGQNVASAQMFLRSVNADPSVLLKEIARRPEIASEYFPWMSEYLLGLTIDYLRHKLETEQSDSNLCSFSSNYHGYAQSTIRPKRNLATPCAHFELEVGYEAETTQDANLGDIFEMMNPEEETTFPTESLSETFGSNKLSYNFTTSPKMQQTIDHEWNQPSPVSNSLIDRIDEFAYVPNDSNRMSNVQLRDGVILPPTPLVNPDSFKFERGFENKFSSCNWKSVFEQIEPQLGYQNSIQKPVSKNEIRIGESRNQAYNVLQHCAVSAKQQSNTMRPPLMPAHMKLSISPQRNYPHQKGRTGPRKSLSATKRKIQTRLEFVPLFV